MHANRTTHSRLIYTRLPHRHTLLLVLSLALATSACSKKEEAAESSVASADMQGVLSEPAAAPAPAMEKSAANPQDVPAILLSEQANPLEKTRPMVKTASVSFEVKDVYQTALQLEQLTTEFAGVVEQKNINKQLENEYQRSNHDGTVYIYQSLRPHGSMIVRIPSEQTQRFINTLPKYMQFLSEQRYEAKRFQLKLLEEKLAQQANSGSSNSKSADRLASEIAELTRQEVQDRLAYSTIQLEFSQPVVLHRTQEIQLVQVAQREQPLLARLWQAAQDGASGLADFAVFVVLLWPAWLILAAIIAVVGWFRKRKQARKQAANT